MPCLAPLSICVTLQAAQLPPRLSPLPSPCHATALSIHVLSTRTCTPASLSGSLHSSSAARAVAARCLARSRAAASTLGDARACAAESSLATLDGRPDLHRMQQLQHVCIASCAGFLKVMQCVCSASVLDSCRSIMAAPGGRPDLKRMRQQQCICMHKLTTAEDA